LQQNENKDIKILMDLGLTSLQAKTYLTLTEIGESPIKTIAKNSNVARQNTYQILSELQEIGLIEKVIAKPIKYKALPLTSAAHMLFKNKTEQYRRVEAQTKELLQRTKENKQTAAHLEHSDEFILIPEKEASTLRIEEAYKNARTSVCTVMMLKGTKPIDLQNLPQFLKKAVIRGINVRHITNKPQDCKSIPANLVWKEKGSYELRYIAEVPPVVFCLLDDKEIFFTREVIPDPSAGTSLWTNNPGLIALAKDYFERTWSKATTENIVAPSCN
jgi:HTH-type transcriptional regulator, sugar sensing transcriptional regulator